MCSCQDFREKSSKQENNVVHNVGSSDPEEIRRNQSQRDSSKYNFENTSGNPSVTNSEKLFDVKPGFASPKKNKRLPRLRDKIFGNQPKHPFFDDPNGFFEGLRKDFGKKMFFDEVDSFGFPNESQSAGTGNRLRRGGFPFDDVRSSGARSRLDDLASRHSMFSSMGNPNNWQETGDMGRWGQRGRNNSGGAASTCSSGAASGSSNASCGEEHVIPIKIMHEGSPSSNANTPYSSSHAPPEPPRRKHQPLGPQRSATDNSYKGIGGGPTGAQEQNRGQRAQSAPPDGSSAVPSPTPQGTQLGGNSSKGKQSVGAGGVRHIPIFVEGRENPVLTKEASAEGSSQTTQNQKLPVFNSSPPKSSRPAEHSPTPPPKKPTPPKDPIEKVQVVSEEVKELELKVKEFVGDSRKDKSYIYLDEMLTRNLIKLDDIETEGRDDIRTARKDCIKLISNCIALLESKILQTSACKKGNQMETEEAKLNVKENTLTTLPPHELSGIGFEDLAENSEANPLETVMEKADV